jgi:Leucine-rich repeat (LRR) protein
LVRAATKPVGGIFSRFSKPPPPPPGAIVIADDATKVDLSSRGIRVVPKEILALKMLQSLSLSFNKIGTLDPEIKQLGTLTKLVLTGNCLKTLPDEIGMLFELREVSRSRSLVWFDRSPIDTSVELFSRAIFFSFLSGAPRELAVVAISSYDLTTSRSMMFPLSSFSLSICWY